MTEIPESLHKKYELFVERLPAKDFEKIFLLMITANSSLIEKIITTLHPVSLSNDLRYLIAMSITNCRAFYLNEGSLQLEELGEVEEEDYSPENIDRKLEYIVKYLYQIVVVEKDQ
jgi:hypothetical protein